MKTLASWLVFLLAGCGPTVIAYPPTSMLPGAIEPLGGGEVALGVGASGMVFDNGNGPGVFFNEFGGPLLVGGGVGLGHGVDVSITASQHMQGPTGGIVAGLWLLDTPRLQAGPLLGLSGSLASADAEFTVPVHDANGPVLDEDGEPVTTGIERHYAYTSFAPSLGGRLVWRPADQWSVPVMVRGTYSMTFAREGLAGWDMPKNVWVEGLAGVGWSPTDHFTLAVATGGYIVAGPDAALPVPALLVNASAHIRFDTTPDR